MSRRKLAVVPTLPTEGNHRPLADGTPIPVASCPFCGDDELQGIFGAPPVFNVVCQACGAEGPHEGSQLQAAERWNDASLPRNPLVDGVAAETLERIAMLQTWLHYRPVREPEGGFAEHIAMQLRCTDGFVYEMVTDALQHVARQVQRS